MRKVLIGFSLLSLSLGFAQTTEGKIPDGPAKEGAYWVLSLYGKLVPYAVITPTQINFGQVKVGETKTATVNITNKGPGYLVIKKIALSQGYAFKIVATNCTKPLDENKSCFIEVSFTPPKQGSYTDSLTFETNDPKHPRVAIPLIGEGYQPIVLPPPQPIPQVKPVKEQKPKEKPKVVKKQPKPKPKPKPRYWVVKPCDTLWDISSSVYGTPLLWGAIFLANQDKIQDPWILQIGQKLVIPPLDKKQREEYKKLTLQLMEEMADRPLGPKCPPCAAEGNCTPKEDKENQTTQKGE
ncbi:MAG: choice-of-anchor D domain-containing protein [Aquificota bacterium]|jgi:hypothetical protein